MNKGKQFEKMWRDSMPRDVYFLRLNDPAQSFVSPDALRFSLKNPFDCLMYRCPVLIAAELKTTDAASFSFWREDFNKRTCMLKKEQVLALASAGKHPGVLAGFVLNFRRTGNVFFVPIVDFLRHTATLNKKSVNESDVRQMAPIIIGSKKLKVNYRYDIGGLFNEARARIFDNFD